MQGGIVLYRAPTTQRVAYRFAAFAGLIQTGVIFRYSPSLFVDNEQTNPNKIDQWKRHSFGCFLVGGTLFLNGVWLAYTRKLPLQVIYSINSLIIQPLSIFSRPRRIPVSDILPTSQILPSTQAKSFVLRSLQGNFFFSSHGVYENRALLKNLLERAIKKGQK